MYLQKVIIYFVRLLKVTDEKSRIRIRTKNVTDPQHWDIFWSHAVVELWNFKIMHVLVHCTDCLQKVLYPCVHPLKAAVLSCT